MSGECDDFGDHVLDCKCAIIRERKWISKEEAKEMFPVEEDINQFALMEMEKVLIRLREIKNYIIEQKELMVEKYPNETHGYQVLHHLHKQLLGFVKEKDEIQKMDELSQADEK